jgi:hypothetical protein
MFAIAISNGGSSQLPFEVAVAMIPPFSYKVFVKFLLSSILLKNYKKNPPLPLWIHQ